jgi:hypothetical protein
MVSWIMPSPQQSPLLGSHTVADPSPNERQRSTVLQASPSSQRVSSGSHWQLGVQQLPGVGSSHCSLMSSTMPLPHPTQTGPKKLQWSSEVAGSPSSQGVPHGSTTQVDEQQSPSATLPSSHPSPTSTAPLPQNSHTPALHSPLPSLHGAPASFSWQVDVQQLVVPPSSHSSPDSRSPSPQSLNDPSAPSSLMTVASSYNCPPTMTSFPVAAIVPK